MLSEIRRIRILELRFEVGSDAPEMLRTDLLHLDLHCPVLRIDIVELLLAGLSRVGLYLGIKIFVDMDDTLHAQSEVIKGTPLIILCHRTDCTLE